MSTFRCAIVTPTEQILDAEVDEVEFPQWDGQRGVLHAAAPFVGRLGVGLLRIRTANDGEKQFLLNGGFAELHDDKLVIVADEIIVRDELDVDVVDDVARYAQPDVPRVGVVQLVQRVAQLDSDFVLRSCGA